MNKNISTKIIGLILIVLGVGYIGDQMFLWHFNFFFQGWWAILIMIFGILNMIEYRINFVNLFISLFGLYLFLSINNIIEFRLTYRVIIAIFICYVGVKLVFPNLRNKPSRKNTSSKGDNGGHLNYQSCFTSDRINYSSKLHTCFISNTFGTLFVDLSNADLSELDEIRLENTMGSLTLMLPNDVKAVIERENILGSCYNDESDGSKEIYIKETCVMGSLRMYKKKKNK